jgi:hypothetical protein
VNWQNGVPGIKTVFLHQLREMFYLYMVISDVAYDLVFVLFPDIVGNRFGSRVGHGGREGLT